MTISGLIFVFCGVIVGIAANYLADVLPRNRHLTAPVCLECGSRRSIKEFLTGKSCQACGKKNSTRYWIVICGAMILSVFIGFFPARNLPFLVSEILFLMFLVMIITDVEYRIILEQVSGAGYILAAFSGLYLHGFNKTILGGISGFLIFLGLYYLGKIFARRMSRNRETPVDEEALGFGDVNLAGIVGFLTGFPYVLPALLMAVVLGGLVSGGVIIAAVLKKQYEAFQAIPYGPFIIIGGIFILYYYL
jgi:leader peptidase (prepilin peptidase)/N-methyltransferase